MVPWLNANSGAVLALLTAVYVICTIILCKLASHTNKTTLKMHLDVQRPVVVCDFLTIHTAMYFRVRNVGPQSARNVRISVVEEPQCSDLWTRNPTITEGITFLAPAQELLAFYQGPGDPHLPKITFDIGYTDASGRRFDERYLCDLSAFKLEDLGRENNAPIVKAVRKIEDELRALTDCLNKK